MIKMLIHQQVLSRHKNYKLKRVYNQQNLKHNPDYLKLTAEIITTDLASIVPELLDVSKQASSPNSRKNMRGVILKAMKQWNGGIMHG